RTVGLDPRHDWLPVAPAAHYLCGGVCTDLDGATVLPGLWACGEAACSGVHGANRLASNSLLDGLVFARRAIDAIGRGKDERDENGVLRGIERYRAGTSPATPGDGDMPVAREALQRLMTHEAGVLRDAASLERAATQLATMAGAADPEVRNLAAVSTGRFVARQQGVLAGTQAVDEVYRQLDADVTVTWRLQDGDSVAAGHELGRVFGGMRSILGGERTALNFLCHLAGVATLTRAFVRAAGGGVRVLDTRKTLPGLRALEKAAVRAGGGHNHRASLSDALLIKDNHLVGLGI